MQFFSQWEKFAAEKGIVKKKKTKLVWDDEVRRFVPRFGYGKAKADGEKNWLMEIKVSSSEMLPCSDSVDIIYVRCGTQV